MTAIVLKDLKNLMLRDLTDFINNPDTNLYIGIGKSLPWNETDTPIEPRNTDRVIRDAMLDTISIKRVLGTSYVVPRYRWSSGTFYASFNDDVPGNILPTTSLPESDIRNAPYYVTNRDNEVFICLQCGYDNNGDPKVSIYEPDQNYVDGEFRTPDGYLWKYLYTIGAEDARFFLGANYMPVQFISDEDGQNPASDDHIKIQYEIQENAVPGQIIGYEVIQGGNNYSKQYPPLVNISGNGIGASDEAVVNDAGQVVYVKVTENGVNPSGSKNHAFGNGYTYASVVVTDNPNQQTRTTEELDNPLNFAKVRPIFAPDNGLGADPRKELRAKSMMFHTKTSGAAGDGDWVTNNDFRQITLLNKPMKDSDGTLVDFTAETGTPLKVMDITMSSLFQPDNLIVGGISGAMGYIVKIENIENDNYRIWYLQNEETTFVPFQLEAISGGSDNNGGGTINTLDGIPEVLLDTSEFLYLDNRAAISRDETQSEDFKIIINV